MNFQYNVIREYLKNVYFVTGTPCGGKTTVSRGLGKKYNIPVYDVDEMFPIHQNMSNVECQPAMNKLFRDADEFFGRTVDEYREWLINNTREQLEFVIMDLIRLSQNGIIICDCHLSLLEAELLTSSDRIAFMIKEPNNLVEDYCNRPDHQDFNSFINGATDVETAKATVSATLKSLNEKPYLAIKESGYFWLERDLNRSVDDTINLVAEHFDFNNL